MKRITKIVIGISFASFIILLIITIGYLFAHSFHVKSTTIVAEGVVEGMYIDISGSLFSTTEHYFLIINGKAIEISENAYNLVQIGDLVRVFLDKHVVIL